MSGDPFKPNSTATQWKPWFGELGGEPTFPFHPVLILPVATLKVGNVAQSNTDQQLTCCPFPEYLSIHCNVLKCSFLDCRQEQEGQSLQQTFHLSNDKWGLELHDFLSSSAPVKSDWMDILYIFPCSEIEVWLIFVQR